MNGKAVGLILDLNTYIAELFFLKNILWFIDCKNNSNL